MIINQTIKLINFSTSVNMKVIENTAIDVEPSIKYRVSKTNAFDPTKLIQRDPYHEDTIKCESVFTPEELDDLIAFLKNSSRLYLEFSYLTHTLQYPVIIDKLPKIPDDARFFNTKQSYSFKAIYKTLEPINFDDTPGYGNYWGLSWGF